MNNNNTAKHRVGYTTIPVRVEPELLDTLLKIRELYQATGVIPVIKGGVS